MGELLGVLRWMWLKGRISQQKKIKKNFPLRKHTHTIKQRKKRLKETSLFQSDCQGIVLHIVNTLWSWKLCVFSLCQVGKMDVPCGRFSHMELFKKKNKNHHIHQDLHPLQLSYWKIHVTEQSHSLSNSRLSVKSSYCPSLSLPVSELIIL